MKSPLEISIQNAQQTVIRRFVFVAIAVMMTASLALVFYVGRNARGVADALSNSYRNQLLIGQLREPIQGLSANIPVVFSSLVYRDAQGKVLFELPESRASSDRQFFELPIEHRIFMSDDEQVVGGVIEYRIVVWPLLLMCVIFNGLAFGLGLTMLRRSLATSRQQVFETYQAQRREEFSLIARQVAHDIRSPLSAIKIAAHSVTTTNAKAAKMMVTASDRIQRMAEDLLAYARRPADELATVSVVHSVTPAKAHSINAIQERLQSLLEEKRIEWELPIQLDSVSPGEVMVACDLDEVSRIISNLVNNAVEATKLVDRAPDLRLKLSLDSAFFTIEVLDNGNGIAADQIPQILAGQSIGKANGNGLGLSSARRTLKAWGGELRMHSQVGQGTQIQVRLPRV